MRTTEPSRARMTRTDYPMCPPAALGRSRLQCRAGSEARQHSREYMNIRGTHGQHAYTTARATAWLIPTRASACQTYLVPCACSQACARKLELSKDNEHVKNVSTDACQ
eukprot:6173305-Pleurochrysis_carterae.AAC.1